MKVTVENRDEVKELPFPKLMISKASDKIVYFTEKGVGVSIHNHDYPTEVEYCTYWDMQFFKDFKGKITLEQ